MNNISANIFLIFWYRCFETLALEAAGERIFTQNFRVKRTTANPINLIFEWISIRSVTDVEQIHFYNSNYWWVWIIFLISLKLCSHNFYHGKGFLFHIFDSWKKYKFLPSPRNTQTSVHNSVCEKLKELLPFVKLYFSVTPCE